MKRTELWQAGRYHLQQFPEKGNTPYPFRSFTSGAAWMSLRLSEMRGTAPTTPSATTACEWYGWLKYSFSGSCFISSFWILWSLHHWLVPLSILGFYLAEVQGLFLFPLLADNAARPLSTSLYLTKSIGHFKAVFTVMPIGCLMLLGLLNLKTPLRNWYIGCLAVLIWYDHEIRNRPSLPL